MATILDILKIIGISEATAGLILHNGHRGYLTTSLTSGDVIIVFPVVAGG